MFIYHTSPATKIRKRSARTTNSAHTDEVFEKISSASIPANPAALLRLQQLIKGDSAHLDRTAIIREIISDPGLGLFYLSHIRSAIGLTVLPENPLLPLQTMSGTELQGLFRVKVSDISKHRLSEAGPPQLLRHQHTFIANKAATNLARQYAIDEGKTFSLVQMSQSALNLIAWSYPVQFHKALYNKRRFKASLEESISSLVGVSTEKIMDKLARKIGLPANLILDLKGPKESDLPDIYSPSAFSLAQIGDLLAQANDREHYPEALEQWERIEQQISEKGFESPSEEIRSEIQSFTKELGAKTALPYQMGLFPVSDKYLKTDLVPDSSHLLNPYLRKVPEKMRMVLEDSYKHIKKDALSSQSLQILVEKLIPELDLISGCLYLLKKDDLTLQPCLNFGRTKKPRSEIALYSANPIAQSVFSSIPQKLDLPSGEVMICGSLPECNKQAVLIMDFSSASYLNLGGNTFNIFNAFALALVDAMGQRE